jgi:hypothetical protein|tara:strand:- start:703 stop:882 length:180 start_codon:yes stop_codon:yes gene_type:complete
MTDDSLSDKMTEKAWWAYKEYLTLDSSDKSIDFTSFAIGFFLGVLSGLKSVEKEYGNEV